MTSSRLRTSNPKVVATLADPGAVVVKSAVHWPATGNVARPTYTPLTPLDRPDERLWRRRDRRPVRVRDSRSVKRAVRTRDLLLAARVGQGEDDAVVADMEAAGDRDRQDRRLA